jgi:pimeloyl-ACP methyl ester carboxylesterase
MPVIDRNGVELYFETRGEGTPLIILHGFMETLEQIYPWVPMLPNYFLILVDVRGHGKSGKPHQPSAYSLSERTLDVIAILDHLGIKKAHYLGYSMGGWIGLALASSYPERFYSVIVGGIGPDALNPELSRFWREPMIEAMKGGMEVYCQRVEEVENRTMSQEERARYLVQDHKALIAMLSHEEEPGFGRALAELDVELLVYVGELDMHHDSARKFCESLERAHFISIPGCDHGEVGVPQDFLVAEINQFLEDNTLE